jgi:hypothetical protein
MGNFSVKLVVNKFFEYRLFCIAFEWIGTGSL